MTYPRIALEGRVLRGAWRVVEDRRDDQHGVPRVVRLVEMTEDTKRDAMGQQVWERLTTKSSHSQWELLATALLDHILGDGQKETP